MEWVYEKLPANLQTKFWCRKVLVLKPSSLLLYETMPVSYYFLYFIAFNRLDAGLLRQSVLTRISSKCFITSCFL